MKKKVRIWLGSITAIYITVNVIAFIIGWKEIQKLDSLIIYRDSFTMTRCTRDENRKPNCQPHGLYDGFPSLSNLLKRVYIPGYLIGRYYAEENWLKLSGIK